ncbi:hypothetical protein PIB30_075386 [Stylosanthes scabra]|uniref:AAA-type ATPase N-terminal domain-containing protein n=1 Tax=Stylosanthes scabra TaxID=79078 RepID=A0ABU6VNL9_9FABA|nr:hypothetical protein [Stylosanthes scabra]
MATTMFVSTMFLRLVPPPLRNQIHRYFRKITYYFHPYNRIKFHEFIADENYLMRSSAYIAIQTYLSEHSSKQASRLKAEEAKRSNNSNTPLVLTMDDNEEIVDEYKGIKVKWVLNKITQKNTGLSS